MKPADSPNHDAPRTRRRASLAIACVVLVAIVVVWFWPKHPSVKATAAVPVNAGHPVNRDFPIRVAAVGTVQALNTVDVKVRVDGQLQHVAFKEGQDVKVGQLLAQLDQGPLTAQWRQAQAAQRKDEASLENAQLDLNRYSQLVGIGAATSQSVDTARALEKSLAATVAADAALVEIDRLQLSFTTLYAPFTGRVGAREADVGAIVHPTDTTGIVTLTQMEPIDVLFSVPQDVLPDLLANQAKAQLPVSVTTRTDGAELAQGSLVFIDSQVDPTTGLIKLKASFTNTDRKLWPGELVNARVLLETARQRIAVPSRAIVNTQAGTQVFAIAPDGKVQMKAVQTGVSADGMTEIKSGIQAGDLIVFDGQSRLNPGVQVAAKIVSTGAEAALAPASSANMDSPS